jgi:hypothetical protein
VQTWLQKRRKKKKKKREKKEKRKKVSNSFCSSAIEAFEVKQHEAKRKKHRNFFGVCPADIN